MILKGPRETLGGGLGVFHHAERDGFGTVYAAGGPDPRPYMLQLSGKPLAHWRAENYDRDIVFQLRFDGVHCTRIDLARDTAGDWTPYRLRDYLLSERYISSWRTKPTFIQQMGGPLTVQLGSRTSDVMLRCYDKRGEMLARGEPCPFPRLSRWELEIKGDLAAPAFDAIASIPCTRNDETGEETWPLERLHAAWLARRLVLTERPVDRAGKNHGRARTCPEWSAFLAPAGDVVLERSPDERGVSQLAAEFGRWLRTLAGSIAAAEALGGRAVLSRLAELGRNRLSARHRALIENIEQTELAFLDAIGQVRR